MLQENKAVGSEDEEQEMKYNITIEEHVSQNFEIEASSIEEAMHIAEENYNSGKFVVESSNVTCKLMQCECAETRECTEWTEF